MTRFQGADAAARAEEHFAQVHARREVPDEGGAVGRARRPGLLPLARLLADAKVVASGSEARRLIVQRRLGERRAGVRREGDARRGRLAREGGQAPLRAAQALLASSVSRPIAPYARAPRGAVGGHRHPAHRLPIEGDVSACAGPLLPSPSSGGRLPRRRTRRRLPFGRRAVRAGGFLRGGAASGVEATGSSCVTGVAVSTGVAVVTGPSETTGEASILTSPAGATGATSARRGGPSRARTPRSSTRAPPPGG